jgi:hypothetical protein
MATVATAGAAAVYAAVWPHELGHALAAFLLGCREAWWPTAVTPWLAGSEPGRIDAACLASRSRLAVAAVALAGIAMNLLLAAGATALARRPRRTGMSLSPLGRTRQVFILLIALANASEAVSYLVPNALWPRADMATAIAAAGVGRLPWLAAGLILTGALAGALRAPLREVAEILASPQLPARAWRRGFVLYALAVATAALVSRRLFG